MSSKLSTWSAGVAGAHPHQSDQEIQRLTDRPTGGRGSHRLVSTGFGGRNMDSGPDVARKSPGRGARAAESDSLLTRSKHSIPSYRIH